MGGKEYLIDTNVAIDYIGTNLPTIALSFIDRVIDSRYYISIINKIEMLGFPNISKQEESKFNDFCISAITIGLDDGIAGKTIEIRRLYKIKLPDAIIAATALVNNLAVITRNKNDFEKIEGLDVTDPYEM
ncbi:MAG: type II toxin-antitoxin system VapC family toxin [Bacteroidales bacterium]|nr:type II toxin-antitoxin system VapC family toxin [Bacteroidales bacterium]